MLAGDFMRDAGRIWSYPAHIKSRDILPIFALAAAVAIVIPNDEAIYRGFRDFRDDHAWVASLSPVITTMGAYGAWGTVGAFLGAGLLAGNARAVETAALAASAMIQTSLVIQVGKGLSGRQRPSWDNGIDHWAGPAAFFKRYESGQMDHYDSFPSGHSGPAFSLATVIAMEYRETVWVPIVAYAVAAGVGLSRLTEDKHWMSDVLVGAVVGHVVARLVVRNHRRRHQAGPVVSVGPGNLTFAAAF
jgi:membrane-associated phospholipid phosphatase